MRAYESRCLRRETVKECEERLRGLVAKGELGTEEWYIPFLAKLVVEEYLKAYPKTRKEVLGWS